MSDLGRKKKRGGGIDTEKEQLPEMVGAEPSSLALMVPIAGD